MTLKSIKDPSKESVYVSEPFAERGVKHKTHKRQLKAIKNE